MAKVRTKKIRSIIVSPQWRGVLDILLRAVIQKKDKFAHDAAKGELWRMAEAADLYNELMDKKPKRKKRGRK